MYSIAINSLNLAVNAVYFAKISKNTVLTLKWHSSHNKIVLRQRIVNIGLLKLSEITILNMLLREMT